jgi:ATP-dependent Clp protease, protease subunit
MKNLMQMLRDNAATERKPLNVVRAEGSSDVTMYVYDVIDAWWGVNAQDVAKAISGLDDSTTLHLRINSPGGDVFEARAIANAIRQFKGKTVAHIDCLAASAATTIALACDDVEIAQDGFFMIHNSWTYAYGNKDDLQQTISLLTQIDAGIVADYAKRTGQKTDQIEAWMNDETWFTADQAVEHGFCDCVMDPPDKAENAAAGKTWNLAAYTKAPKALTEPPVKPAPDVTSEQLASAAENRARRMRLLALA